MEAEGLQLGEQEGQRQGRGGVPRDGGKGLGGRGCWGGGLILWGLACPARKLGLSSQMKEYKYFDLVFIKIKRPKTLGCL